jgi:hypothetical protein
MTGNRNCAVIGVTTILHLHEETVMIGAVTLVTFLHISRLLGSLDVASRRYPPILHSGIATAGPIDFSLMVFLAYF